MSAPGTHVNDIICARDKLPKGGASRVTDEGAGTAREGGRHLAFLRRAHGSHAVDAAMHWLEVPRFHTVLDSMRADARLKELRACYQSVLPGSQTEDDVIAVHSSPQRRCVGR